MNKNNKHCWAAAAECGATGASMHPGKSEGQGYWTGTL